MDRKSSTSEIWIVLTDDWELRGNGTGTVEESQRRPALRLMDLYEQFGIRSTFNLEVMQQIAFEEYANRHEEIRSGRDAWLDAVRAMVNRGFDTQLHIHPQWWGAEYVDGWWKLGRHWNIAAYSKKDVEQICDEAISYILPLIAPRSVTTFRAGSWGMGPPSRIILEALIQRGVTVDVSIAAGLRYEGEGIRLDYSQVDSPHAAYRPDIDDIRRIGSRTTAADLIEIPTQSVTEGELRWGMISGIGSNGGELGLRAWVRSLVPVNLRRRIAQMRGAGVKQRPMGTPEFVMLDPFGEETSDFGNVIDISRQLESGIFCAMSDVAIKRARRLSGPAIKVLVFENHTKDLQTSADFERIRSILKHIQKKHPDVKFRTLHDVSQNLASIV
jgi:hypothetical protein